MTNHSTWKRLKILLVPVGSVGNSDGAHHFECVAKGIINFSLTILCTVKGEGKICSDLIPIAPSMHGKRKR